MARYTGAVCKLCRREGVKLYLKGERCYKSKCALERKAYAPGQHGQQRKKVSEYGTQLREKQKVKRIYGVLERQFRKYFQEASRKQGITGDLLLQKLESRLDNTVFRAGFANSRSEARQLVRHSHFLVNGKRVDIPSFSVSSNDVIELKEVSRDLVNVKNSLETSEGRGVPAWIELDKTNYKAKIARLPERGDINYEVSEHLIVELYSK